MEQTPQAPSLKLEDLKAIHSIIEVAVGRGAFQASELTGIGRAYDTLTAFLTYVAQQEEARKLLEEKAKELKEAEENQKTSEE